MTNALIIGYGRAGKRHGRMLDKLGIEWVAFDPYSTDEDLHLLSVYKSDDSQGLDKTLNGYNPNFAIIATPPALHLAQIRQCLDAGLPVLCEKPLCGFGQLEQAKKLLSHPHIDRLVISYNFRYHPKLIAAVDRIPDQLTCLQERDDLPEWGLLLDHVSHDLDILRFLCGDIEITNARHIPVGWYNHDPKRQTWIVTAKVDNKEIVLKESVGNFGKRVARLEYWQGDHIDIDPDPAMFKRMYEAFLDGRYEPGLEEAIKTQELLEKCMELENVKS